MYLPHFFYWQQKWAYWSFYQEKQHFFFFSSFLSGSDSCSSPKSRFRSFSKPTRYVYHCKSTKLIRLALKLFGKGQKYDQANSAPRNWVFKARNCDLYYKSLYIKYYYFYWQYKDYFNMAKTTDYKSVFFTAMFLQNLINFY